MKKFNMFPYSLSEFFIIFQLVFLSLAPAAFSSDDAVLPHRNRHAHRQ